LAEVQKSDSEKSKINLLKFSFCFEKKPIFRPYVKNNHFYLDMQSDVTQIDQSPTLKQPTSGNRATSNIAAGTPAKQPGNTKDSWDTASDLLQ
jgi:hypothetical protein